MAEPTFGTVSPIWSAVPFPGVAWYQAPMVGAGPIGSTPTGNVGPQGSAAFGSGMMTGRGILQPGTVSGFGAGASNYASTPFSAPVSQWGPPMSGPEMSPGITAPVLVSAIAMRRGQPAGPTSDQEIEDFIYDALDLLPGSSEVEVRCDAGRTSLMGAVSQKRLKRDIGEIAWAIPGINDVQNNIAIAPRRRARAQSRETETPAVASRKTA